MTYPGIEKAEKKLIASYEKCKSNAVPNGVSNQRREYFKKLADSMRVQMGLTEHMEETAAESSPAPYSPL